MLIHEATFEAAKAQEAVERRHSTVDEALDVARRMGAVAVLLTHFRWVGACVGGSGGKMVVRVDVCMRKRRLSDQPTQPKHIHTPFPP